MSAFMVDVTTMHRAVGAMWHLCALHDGGDAHRPAMVGGTSDPDKIGQHWFRLNRQAVNGRYLEDEKLTNDEARYIYSVSQGHAKYGVLACLKALDCLLYQCAEDPVCDTPEFLEMQQLRDALCREYISTLPEYQEASWGP